MNKIISPDLIAKLLNEEKTPQVLKHETIRQSRPKTKGGPWKRVEHQLFCVSKHCRIETWMTFDGVPYCTLHGLNYLNEMVMTLTKRLEESYKTRGTTRVIGDLLGNDYKEDSMTEEIQNNEEPTQNYTPGEPEPGNQSDLEVEELRLKEAEAVAGEDTDEDEDLEQ